MSGHLIALDKQPGVCLVGVGENWRHLFAKCVLKVTGPEANNMCQDDQICAVLKEGIYRAIHSIQSIWGANSSTEDWLFLLVDSKKAFNKVNRIGML